MKKYYLFFSFILIFCQTNIVWALENKDTSPKDYYDTGIILYNLGQYERAIEAFDKVLELEPNDFTAYSNKGLCLNNLSKYDEAIKAYNEAIKLNPNNSGAYYNKGLFLAKIGQYNLALEAYNKALE